MSIGSCRQSRVLIVFGLDSDFVYDPISELLFSFLHELFTYKLWGIVNLRVTLRGEFYWEF